MNHAHNTTLEHETDEQFDQYLFIAGLAVIVTFVAVILIEWL